MTKLSELIKDRESFQPGNEEDYFVFGIEVDTDDVTPPQYVREIGLIAQTENGELTNEVLDVAISYVLAGIDVLLEFPAEVDCGDARHLMATAASVNASLSFLPPKELTPESFERYCQRLEAITAAYLKQLTMTKFVMPITNYLQYCYIEVLDPDASKNFVPEDGYVLSRFHGSMTVEQADTLKERVRTVIVDNFGGEYEFRSFALGMMGSVSGAVETSLAEIVAESRQKKPPVGWYWLVGKEDGEFVMSRFDGDETWYIEQPDGSLDPIATSLAGQNHILVEAALPPSSRVEAAQAPEASAEPDDEPAPPATDEPAEAEEGA
jgi:hypothetical protein